MADIDNETEVPKVPGEDIPVTSKGSNDLTVLNAIRVFKDEARRSRITRLKRNRENRHAYMGIQDWDHKNKGQSREFLPKTPVAVEQFTGFIKRALTQFGAYYDVELGRDSKSPISGESIRRLMDIFLNKLLVEDNKESSFPVLLTDALKSASLESLVILKVHGNMKKDRRFFAEEGQPILGAQPQEAKLKTEEVDRWHLRIDLVRTEDYYPDPTGAGLYEIHSTERDLYYLKDRAREGIYDAAAVAMIEADFKREEEEERREFELGQDEFVKPSFRKRVVIDEFWGNILDTDGNVVHRNVFCAMANDKFLIRKPTPNPFWHQESPFVVAPLIRVPHSTWHKALFDHAVQINYAMNELFNLIIDGGISSVWGIKQLRIDDLEDPRQVSDGIAQGDTLSVKGTMPPGTKVLETISQGEVPGDSMAVLEMLSREFAASALSNELKLGSLPGKDVLATEIVEQSQSQAVTMDGIVGDIERELIAKGLRKIWLTILQNMDDVSSADIVNAIGLQAAFKMSQMSKAERFATFANDVAFKVNGLTAVLAKTRDFQKLMALLQAVSTNPIMLQAFFRKYSPDRVLAQMMKTLSINPEQMKRDEEEMNRLEQDIAGLPQFQELTGQQPGGAPGIAAQDVGEPGLPAEINAISNPSASLAGAGES